MPAYHRSLAERCISSHKILLRTEQDLYNKGMYRSVPAYINAEVVHSVEYVLSPFRGHTSARSYRLLQHKPSWLLRSTSSTKISTSKALSRLPISSRTPSLYTACKDVSSGIAWHSLAWPGGSRHTVVCKDIAHIHGLRCRGGLCREERSRGGPG